MRADLEPLRVAWLPGDPSTDRLGALLEELGDLVVATRCRSLDALLWEASSRALDVALVPCLASPSDLEQELEVSVSCVLAYGEPGMARLEPSWLAAGAAGLVELEDAEGLLRFLVRARAVHRRAQRGKASPHSPEELARALHAQEFELHYQPIVDLMTGQVRSFEALLRWNHPIRGRVSPLEFVPSAEQSGLIVPIGRWVIQAACQAVHAWRSRVPGLAGASINVNLSPYQLRDPDLAQTVAEALASWALDPGALRLELTENHHVVDVGTEIARLEELARLGVEIHVDDFGTGFATLGYLAHLPVHAIKLDRSLIREVHAHRRRRVVVEHVVRLADELGLEVIAEGIETREELGAVRAFGVAAGQGYLFSPPVPTARVPDVAWHDLRALAR